MPYNNKAEYKKEWYEKNKEGILQKARARYHEKKEEIKKKSRDRYYANREEILRRDKLYREKNREKFKGRSQEWAKKNPEKRRAICKRYYEKKLREDPEWANKRARKYYYRDVEKSREKLREYRKSRVAWCRLQKYKRRERCGSRQVDKQHLNKEFDGLIQSKLEGQGGKCVYCGRDIRDNFSIDHIKPLSRGGSNEIDNMDLVCMTCNTRKSTREKEYFLKLIKEGHYNE